MMKKRNPNAVVIFLVFLLFMEMNFSVGTGTIGAEMVRVEGGSFLMGNERNDSEGDSDEKPVHAVSVTDYWIGKYEVTFGQYDAYCDATGESKPSDSGWGRGTRPVNRVDWWEAIGYCNWLSEREGIAVAYRLEGEANAGSLLDENRNVTTDVTRVKGYRLPTEAEWEYAARGGRNTQGYKYSGSNTLDEVGWYSGNSGGPSSKTQAVGQKKANELGIYDMSGNVWEWCHDWYDGSYYSKGAQTNPIGPSSGSYRVNRGGSWLSVALACRVADRYVVFGPSGRDYFLGFRLVRTF